LVPHGTVLPPKAAWGLY